MNNNPELVEPPVNAQEETSTMERKTTWASLFNLAGGLSGLLSIIILIWQGGQLYQRVEDHGKRLDRIDQDGSGGFRAHEKADDERVADIKSRLADQALRLTHFEEVTTKLLEYGGELKAMNIKIDSLKDRIERKP